MELNKVKTLASKVMKIGRNKVKINDSEAAREVMTRADVREKINQEVITKKPKKGTSKGRSREKKEKKKKGRMKGRGSKKGAKKAQQNPKREWIKKVRAQRKKLREVKPDLKEGEYRKLYKRIKGGHFKSKKQLTKYIEEKNLMKEGD